MYMTAYDIQLRIAEADRRLAPAAIDAWLAECRDRVVAYLEADLRTDATALMRMSDDGCPQDRGAPTLLDLVHMRLHPES